MRTCCAAHSVLCGNLNGEETPNRVGICTRGAFLVARTVKNAPTNAGRVVRSLGQGDLLEKEMAAHSSVLAWRIPWTEEPGGLRSMGSQRVGHDLVAKQQQHIYTYNWLTLLYSRN